MVSVSASCEQDPGSILGPCISASCARLTAKVAA